MIIGECASEHLKLTIEEKKSQFDRENLDHSLFSFVPFCSSMVEIFYQMFTRNLYLFVSLLFSFAHFYIGVCQLNYTNAHVVCSIESIELGICKYVLFLIVSFLDAEIILYLLYVCGLHHSPDQKLFLKIVQTTYCSRSLSQSVQGGPPLR